MFFESDVSYAEKAIKLYNDRVRLDSVFCDLAKTEDKTVTVSFENDAGVIRNFVPSALRLINAGINVLAVCKAESLGALREECYKNGAVCHGTEYRKNSAQTVDKIAKSSSKRGALASLYVHGDEKALAAKIATREKSGALVYLTLSGGIILNGKPFPTVISSEVCDTISKRLNSRYLSLASEAIRGGADTVAVIDGSQKDALAFYSVGHGFVGTVIKRDKNA